MKSCILDELRDGIPKHPSDIQKLLPESAPRVLDISLKEMVEDGLVNKKIYPGFPPGQNIKQRIWENLCFPIIDSMMEWGKEHMDLFEKKFKNQK